MLDFVTCVGYDILSRFKKARLWPGCIKKMRGMVVARVIPPCFSFLYSSWFNMETVAETRGMR